MELTQTCARSTVSRHVETQHRQPYPRIKGWTEFYASVVAIADETGKGDCFERLMQLYMQSAPHMVSHYKHVWLRSEVTGDVKITLGLPDTDEGIDIIAETHHGDFLVRPSSAQIRCKA